MSIKSKTLAIMIATALGVSFGASANSGYGGHGGGYGGGWGGHEDPAGTDMTNDDGNQAGDDLTNVDLDFNKWIYKTYDWDLKVKVDTNLNHQSNFTFQGGHTGNTDSYSDADSYAGSHAGNLGLMGQYSENGALGVGVGFGAGLGAASSEANGDDSNGGFPRGLVRRDRHGGREDGGDVESGDAGGAGYGAGMGAGVGMAKLHSDQDLDQNAASASWSQAASVSMIQSGNNNLSNTGTMHGINVQGAVSGHSSMVNQSVNVNGSVQF